MSDYSQRPIRRHPFGVAIIAIVNGLALLVTLAFWGLVFAKRLVPPPGDLTALPERANAATTYGFMIGDIVWSVPLLFLATVGVWRLRFWGWTAAQMANALWFYSMTVVWIRDAYTTASPGGVLFLPFALVSLWATLYLWKHRALFVSPASTSIVSTPG